MTAPVRATPRRRLSRAPRAGGSSIALLSTFPPTQCGLATFTSALHAALATASTPVGVVRVVDAPTPLLGAPVVAHLVNGSTSSARAAREVLDGHDCVVVQHEYGIFGGPDGSDVVELVEALTVPVVVVMHTVLQAPTSRQRSILVRLLHAADQVVTMTETARTRLVEVYGAAPGHVTVIPHGATDHGAATPPAGPADRPLVLTWGLLGPGKGIEWAIDAMAGLRDLSPHYLVAGRTHPKVAERHGEAYREGLARRIAERGVGDLVELDDSYLDGPRLAALVARAALVLLPYDSREQVTSGVLNEAVAAGRPVVSTAFPHAVELLVDGPGLVVPQCDAAGIEQAVRRVLTEPGLARRLADSAAQKAPELRWGAVAGRYRALADELVAAQTALSA